jgi:hypothetical protein
VTPRVRAADKLLSRRPSAKPASFFSPRRGKNGVSLMEVAPGLSLKGTTGIQPRTAAAREVSSNG